MTMKGIFLLILVSCCFGLALSMGNDFKDNSKASASKENDFVIGKKPDDASAIDDPTVRSSAPSGGKVNWCDKADSRCPINVCKQAGKECCWCDPYCKWDPYGVIQPCFCCPEDHKCCSVSRPLGLKSPPTCCPPDMDCSENGRSCVHKVDAVAAEVITNVCDASDTSIVNPKLPSKKDRSASTLW